MHFYLVNQSMLNNFLPIGQRRLIVPYSESACKTASDRMSPHVYFDDWKTFIFSLALLVMCGESHNFSDILRKILS